MKEHYMLCQHEMLHLPLPERLKNGMIAKENARLAELCQAGAASAETAAS